MLWLVGWLVGWLVDWLVGWLVGSLVGCLVGCLVVVESCKLEVAIEASVLRVGVWKWKTWIQCLELEVCLR